MQFPPESPCILLCFMTVCMYRDIHTLQPYIIAIVIFTVNSYVFAYCMHHHLCLYLMQAIYLFLPICDFVSTTKLVYDDIINMYL